MEETRKKRSRLFRQYLVKRGLQFKFTFMVTILLSVMGLTIWIGGHFAILELVDQGVVNDEVVIEKMELLNQIVLKITLIAILVGIVGSFVVSNYVAGPIYRFEQILKQIKTGDISMRVRIRKNDELQDTAKLFDDALASLREKWDDEKKETHFLLTKAVSELSLEEEGGRLNSIINQVTSNSAIKTKADPK